MKTSVLFFFFLFGVCGFSQNITNTLGAGGLFKIKDAANDYLTLTQSTGQVNILKTLRLENTTSSTTGVIFKGVNRFIHDLGSNNTFMGRYSGNFTLISGSAINNTGVGQYSLESLTTGNDNAAVGYFSLRLNAIGDANTAVGYTSLSSNTTGSSNTAIGWGSLLSNTTGSNNTAIGLQSLSSNTTGRLNTAVGFMSLYSNTGFSNTAVGSIFILQHHRS